MVLFAELLLAVGILVGLWLLATRPGEGMAPVVPDRRPSEQQEDGPLTADDLVAMHLPIGVGYRKVDVDLLLDRIARQLPRATYAVAPPNAVEPNDAQPEAESASDEPERISLAKEEERG